MEGTPMGDGLRVVETQAAGAREGSFGTKEDRVAVIENAGALFVRLMNGQNFVKAILAIGPQ